MLGKTFSIFLVCQGREKVIWELKQCYLDYYSGSGCSIQTTNSKSTLEIQSKCLKDKVLTSQISVNILHQWLFGLKI
ncbi:hypothetical protein H5410_023613 [Solanum commersonii]|uniref:Uncharacterized protein n=1 Tax=Solanum commersonii TaxID=4109 RepID=A0A9J5ZJS6_SOLCO|nr:hypothetical protein H5410_023613 [Solanum commersonii]